MKQTDKISLLSGANMDIDLIPTNVDWHQDMCPWSKSDNKEHKCATKNISICDYFCGIDYPDKIQCSYPDKIND